jgi:general nucleoside transport system ATP-binding protein
MRPAAPEPPSAEDCVRPLLRVEQLTKRFPDVAANDALNLEILPGEVHALLGENGAGKTTLMNLLCGLLTPDEGRIYWQEAPVAISSPGRALELGIGMVHQHFMLVPRLTILENVLLGLGRGLRRDRTSAEQRLRDLAKAFWPSLDPHRLVDSLSIGEKQKVEILKALYREIRLLILDEPTAALAPHEAQILFEFGRTLTAQGGAIIFITHRMEEAMAFSDRISVLRQGQNVGTVPTRDTSPRGLARLMVGRDLPPSTEKISRRPGAVLLEAAGLSTSGPEGSVALDDLSFDVKEGEILGFAGVDGNGQTEVVEALLGLRPASRGRIVFRGRELTGLKPKAIYDHGLAVLPGDRHAAGMIENLDLMQNGLLGLEGRAPWSRRGFLQRIEIQRLAEGIVSRFSVKASSVHASMDQLSGGHQQRFVVGRTLCRNPEVLIAVQPTRGLDLESAEFIRTQLLKLREEGRGILLVSTDLDEIIRLSDRIDVLYGGRIIGRALPGDNREEIGLLMAGVNRGRPPTPMHS